MCINNQDHMMYGSWDMKCNKHNFFVILDNFLPFYLPNTLKNKNMKNKKNPGNIIILHKCTKNHDHMLYRSWDMAHDRCNYFSFWAILCPFTTLTAPQKWKFQKNEKNAWRYCFTQIYQKSWLHAILFLRYGTWWM